MSSPEAAPRSRRERLRSPLLLVLWVLLAIEAVGGLVIFCARLVAGSTPGEAFHVVAGAGFAGVYAAYQWTHWRRVRPLRSRLDYTLGLIGASSMALTLFTGFALALPWWGDRIAAPKAGPVEYAPLLSALHNIASMIVLTFVGAHLGAVLMRDRDRS